MEVTLARLSRKDTIDLLYLIYQHISDLNAADLNAVRSTAADSRVEPKGLLNGIYTKFFGTTKAESKLIDTLQR